MKEYKIQSKSTNGIWVDQGYKEFSSEGEAKTFARNRTAKRGFEYRVVFVRTINASEREEVANEVEESEEQNQVEAEVEETQEEVEEVVEESNDPEEVEQLDYDFAESHDRDEFPRGWWLQKEFVAKDGTVFHLKEEQPELYRTRKPSDY